MNIEPNSLYLGDSLEIIKAMPDKCVNHIITDPPYGLAEYDPIEIDRPHKTGGTYKRVNEEWDKTVPIEWMEHVKRILKPKGNIIIFNGRVGLIKIGAKGLELGWKLTGEVTWFKNDAPPNFSGRGLSAKCEKFYVYSPHNKGAVYNLEYAKQANGGVNFNDLWAFGAPRGDNRYHPTQKPLDLMVRIIQLWTKPDDLILDPFMGSGSTCVAAKNVGRNYIGIDIDQQWLDIASDRLKDVLELPLFQPLAKQESFI